MTNQQPFSRHFLILIVFLLYLCPFFILAFSLSQNLEVLGIGLLASVVGSLILFTIIRNWQNSFEFKVEESAPPPVIIAPPTLPQASTSTVQSEKYEQLLEELETKKEEALRSNRERSQLQQLVDRLEREKAEIENRASDILQENESHHKEYLKTISQQRDLIDQQEGHIANLENQIRDLKYEIKTLIEIGPSDVALEPFTNEEKQPEQTIESPLPPTLFSPKVDKRIEAPMPIEADLQLKRCLDIAQKITGTSLFGGQSSRFRDLSVNNYSIDLRQLLDSLRSENSNTIILYSHKEEKLLFVNNQAKGLLGWSPDKFVQEFPDLIQEGLQDWKMALNNVSAKGDVKVKLIMKSKSGQNVPVHCHLGVIPTGVFRNDIIGVIY